MHLLNHQGIHVHQAHLKQVEREHQNLPVLQLIARELLRALSPLKWQHVNPHGTFTLNMHERLPLEQVAGSPVPVGQPFGLR